MVTSSAYPTSETPLCDGGESNRFVERVVQGAHDAVDRAADRTTPAVERVRSGIVQIGQSFNERADRLGEMQEQWLQTCRDSVREHPIRAVATGVLFGWLLARITAR